MELEYSVKRSAKRRKLTITVERDRKIIVHAPESTSQKKIEEVIESKRQWIFEKLKHKEKYKKRPHPPGKEIVDGESALYLGRNYRIELVAKGLKQVEFDYKFRVPKSFSSKRKEVLKEWYIARAKEKINPRVKRFSKEIGVEYNLSKIVDNKYSWGSCTPQNNINLNWRLIKAPMFVIDYVIVHELAHLREPNHDNKFWNIVRSANPNADKARAWLKENGGLLEEVI